MAKTFGRLFRDEQGATAVEYGLLVAGVAAVIVVVVFALGRKINNSFVRINSQL
jgi:pilus assembly protein Flp/PilA